MGLHFKRQPVEQPPVRSRRPWHPWAIALHHRWRRSHWCWKLLTGLVVLLLMVRSLPYLAPIRASDLVQDQRAIAFTDRNGLPLGTLLTRDQEHTIAVPLSQVSANFKQAIVAAEDRRFYQHGAVDGRAIGRALLEAIQTRQLRSGASTITMQLARMLDPMPRTLPGKLKEVWTAWRLFAGMTRDDILQAYINRLPMGGNVYGVEASARLYFGIPASELNVAQASLLAAIPNDPNRLNPYDRWEPLKQRQTYVLDRMVKDGYLNRTQADHTFNEDISLQPRQQGIVAAPHFQFWLADQLSDRKGGDRPSQVRTTLDRPLQQFVEAQVQQVIRTLATNNVHHGAALVVDNHTGEVLAYVGSPDYFADTQLGRNDGVQALRQPGSTLKPFVYELALEKRTIRPNTILPDVPTHYAIPGAKLYSPSDYSETFQGPVRVRLALANSLNIPAVRVLEKVGVPLFLERLRQLGFEHLNHAPDYYGLGLTLGSGEVSLWELARAYLTMARQGEPIPLVVTASLETSNNSNTSPPPSLPPSPTWSLITDILSDRHARARAFGVESLLSLPFATAVKTGTSSDFHDTWTVGFSRDYTVAVWVGNFDGQAMRRVTGVTGAAPLWNRIMLHLHEKQEPEDFPPPAGMVARPICALSGARPNPACPTVVQEYFNEQDLIAYDRQPDPFYQVTTTKDGKPQYRLKLPTEYNEWLATQPSILATDGLRIVSPRQGDVFLLDAIGATETAAQQLEFKLAKAPTEAVEWQLNGRSLAKKAGSVFWQPKPGNWTLQVKQGDQTDQVSFQVQVAEARNARRGFSFAP